MYTKLKSIIYMVTKTLLVSFILMTCSCKEIIHTGKNSDYPYEIVKGDPQKVRIYTLKNGLKVYLSVNKIEPRIQTAIAVKAGGKTDPDNATGMAHYLEHMLFKGTDEFGTINWEKEQPEIEKIIELYELYGQTTDSLKRKSIYHQIDSISLAASEYAIPNEYDKIIGSMGAEGTNAFTSVEQTVYINDIPGNQFDKWIKLEYERFSDPVLRLFHTELETVYEEKNRALDNDGRKLSKALMLGLFPKHPYGTHTVLGTIQHLKNPPMKKVIEYFNTYYVPNNMAICMSGDFNPDSVIRAIDQYFGKMEVKPLAEFNPPVENPIIEPVIKTVMGPSAESVQLAFRFPGVASDETALLIMCDMILNNSAAGLIDLNLNQQQKVMGAYSYPRTMKDYSYHALGARAREGQELEEVTRLLLSQIELLKSGDFADWLPNAIVSNMKRNELNAFDSNRSRAFSFVDAFSKGVEWEKKVHKLDYMATITKKDIMDFAKRVYGDNYVVVYKRTGVDDTVEKIVKPEITPVSINRSDQSKFAAELAELNVSPIEPAFIDFTRDMDQLEIRNDVSLLYKQNTQNNLFSLYYLVEMGNNHDKRLGLALSYLEYLGTDKYTPEQIKQEFYKIASSFNVNVSNDRIWVSLSGLQENFLPGLKLFEHVLHHAEPNQEALDNLISDIIKGRADTKLSKRSIGRALNTYGKYGPLSPSTHLLSETELTSVTARELIDLISSISQYEHRIMYYGPLQNNALKSTLISNHTMPEVFLPIPKETVFTELDTDENRVFVVDYDMRQAEIRLLSKNTVFNPDNLKVRALFNEYYGGGMGSIIFQTMREAKALAYSVYAFYSTPDDPDESHYIQSYIGTQADKMPEALDGLFELLNEMPESELSFTTSKEAILNRIKTERISKGHILFRYLQADRMGIDHDTRRDLYDEIPNMEFEKILTFFDDHIKGQNYHIMVLADTGQIDLEALNHYGDVKFLSLEEIFGY